MKKNFLKLNIEILQKKMYYINVYKDNVIVLTITTHKIIFYGIATKFS